MRLTCPRCGAQYEIDAAAIPPSGRDVECSACEHVWRVMPAAEPFDPAARPSLSRPLSESVIEILREEAARELEVRAAERRTRRAAERAGELAAGLAGPEGTEQAGRTAPADAGAGDEEAATDRDGAGATIIPESAGSFAPGLEPVRGSELDELAAASPSAAGRGEDSSAAEIPALRPLADGSDDAGKDMGRTDGQPACPPLDGQVPGGGDSSSRATAPLDALEARRNPGGGPPSPAHTPPVIPQAPRAGRGSQARRRHDAGFRAAVLVALVAVALYVLAPRIADQGPLGEAVAGWRAEVDRGRDWLSAQGDALTDRLRGVTRAE